ncbi:MAG: metal-binding protein [Methylococcaceae bacterium]|jgi:hypothetical protein|nr:metal-binding protein [Methylococcales bacterium]MCX7076156.1 metal-binding protein [Methylococcales bacterium]
MSVKKDQQQTACPLCGLPVKIHDFLLKTPQGDKCFCCAGCLSIYQLFHGEE